MRGFLGVMAAVTLPLGSPAAAHPDRVPIACDDGQVNTGADAAISASSEVVGTYRCSFEGLTISLDLTANGTFEQRMVEDSPSADQSDSPWEELPFRLTGRWRIEEGRLLLYQRPARKPTIRLVGLSRDPSVWLRIEVRDATGRPASGVDVRSGAYFNYISPLPNGVMSIPRDHDAEPGTRAIVRSGDELTLATVSVTKDGPNSFLYQYVPSEVEPFEIASTLVGDPPSAVIVPLGIGGALLKRVPAR